MAKYCRECGAMLDEVSGRCPRCTAKFVGKLAVAVGAVLSVIIFAVYALASEGHIEIDALSNLSNNSSAVYSYSSSARPEQAVTGERIEYPAVEAPDRAPEVLVDYHPSPEPEYYANSIPYNAVSYNGHHYAIVPFDDLPGRGDIWVRIKDYCVMSGGYPASISSPEENLFLYTMLENSGYDEAYIGLHEDGRGGWEWYNGESIDFYSWGGGEPMSDNGNSLGCLVTWLSTRWIARDPNTYPENREKAVIQSVAASSYLRERTIFHYPENMLDGDLSTAWCEGAAGVGIGEYAVFYFDEPSRITEMNISTGYQWGWDYYAKNCRPARIRLDFSDGSYDYCELNDYFGLQTVSFSTPKETEWVKLSIESVYYGYKYEDTLISEINFFKENSTGAFICEWSA